MIRLTDDLTKRPHSSIPEACSGSAQTKAAYRFLSSEKIKLEDIEQSIVDATLERIEDECQKNKEEEVILIPHDTSELNFSHLHKTKDLGPISNANCRGIISHTAMALTSKGKPLGILYQEFWERRSNHKKKSNNRLVSIEKKESYKWIKTIKRLDEIISEEQMTISISDRESDIYDYFATERRENHHILFRVTHDRCLKSSRKSQKLKLFDTLRLLKESKTITIKLSRNKSVKARELQVQVSFLVVEILPPRYLKSKYSSRQSSSVRMTAIYVRDSKGELEWFLLSSIIAASLDEAVELVRYYEKRWLIERYHFILKSGCQVEELQLSEVKRLQKAIALYSIVAWRIMYMTYISRLEPLKGSDEFLSESEWKALYIFSYKRRPEDRPPPISEAVMMIAKLGGFQGRVSDGYPGAKVIWRGMKRLSDITKAYEIYQLMGNA